MSQEGLLQSLIKQLLEKVLEEPSGQLTSKLEARITIEESDRPVKYFFFIDSLDEVEGDQASLVSLVHALGTYPNIKV